MNISILLLALVVGISDTCSTNGVIGASEYVESVRRVGGTPVVVCRTSDQKGLDAVVAGLDFLILTGGEDVAPARYGAEPSPKLGRVNAVRDEYEWALLSAAVRHGVPIFGTCRGVQMMNVFFGGTLYQDLPSEFPYKTPETHSSVGGWEKSKRIYRHEILIEPGSRLADVCDGATRLPVNSAHHQAVKRLAPGFRVAARSPEGVVESIECDWYPAAGVQFHPEVLLACNDDPVWKRFYERLSKFAGTRRGASQGSDPIGVFDSGIGGLSVLEKILTLDSFDNATGEMKPDGIPDFRDERFVYFGDQANMPYGRYDAAGKADFLRELVVRDTQFVLGSQGHDPSKAVVIACNTATAYGFGRVSAMARPGDTSVIGVVNAGVEGALDAMRGETRPYAIGVMATPATISSGVYERTLRAGLAARGTSVPVEIANRGGIGLAEAVENSEPGMRECARTNFVALVEDYRARGGKAPIKAIILGCTHYPFVLDEFRVALADLRKRPECAALIADDVVFVDPAVNTAVACYKSLRERGLLATRSATDGRRRVEAFISVGKSGPLPDAVKYGREVGSHDIGTKIVPMVAGNMPPGAPEMIRAMMPASAAAVLGMAHDVPARHRPKRIMGRDYWTALYPHYDHGAYAAWASGDSQRVRTDNPEVNSQDFIRDAVPVYHAQRQAPDDSTGLATWRTMAENFLPDEADREILNGDPKPDRPFILGFSGKRNVSAYGGRIELDCDEWRAWRAAHTNLLCCWTHIEWDNAMSIAYARVGKIADETRRHEVEAFLGPRPRDRFEHLKLQRKYYDRMNDLYYGGGDVAGAMFASRFCGHVAAAWGAKLLIVETTNTADDDSEYRWNLAPMFTRGAARQFDLPWEWYVAVYMNGRAADGRWLNDAECVYPASAGAKLSTGEHGHNSGPDYGVSRSLQRRAWYFAYLNGANLVEQEEWTAMLLRWDDKLGKTVLSKRGEDFRDYHAFTKAHSDRGTPYAPVAILVPFAQGYCTLGGSPWGNPAYGYTAGDHALDALFFALAPGYDRRAGLLRGDEANLHNSRFALMYDVLTPDAPQDPSEFARVLASYRAVIVAGDYPDRSFEGLLADYERHGGKVVRIGTAEVPPPGPDAVASLRRGTLHHPKVEEILEGLQDWLFPFKVEGDCLYGANRTEKGWWLWVFNNRGVTKFADKPQSVDASAASDVRVGLGGIRASRVKELMSGRDVEIDADATFAARIPSGDLAVFEIVQ